MTDEEFEAIRHDCNRKSYVLLLLEKMVYGLDQESIEIHQVFNERQSLVSVVVEKASGAKIEIPVEGDSPLTMVKEIIEKAHLG